MSKLVAFALLLAISCGLGVVYPDNSPLVAGYSWAGITGGNRREPATSYNWYYISDIHWSGATGNVGGRYGGKQMIREMVSFMNSDAQTAFWIIGGDCRSGNNYTSADTDSLYWTIADSTGNYQVYALIGNHEWTVADTVAGNLYNTFIGEQHANFPYTKRQFAELKDATSRGRRWYGVQPHFKGAPCNLRLFATQNNADNAAKNYVANFPYASPTLGHASGDFDGIKDYDSPQRVDLRAWLAAREGWTWEIVAGHRTEHTLTSVGIRPPVEGVTGGSGFISEIDSTLKTNWIYLQGDDHIWGVHNKHSHGSGPGHWTIDATTYARQAVIESLTAQDWDMVIGFNDDGSKDNSNTASAFDTVFCASCPDPDNIVTAWGSGGQSVTVWDAHGGDDGSNYSVLWKFRVSADSMYVNPVMFDRTGVGTITATHGDTLIFTRY